MASRRNIQPLNQQDPPPGAQEPIEWKGWPQDSREQLVIVEADTLTEARTLVAAALQLEENEVQVRRYQPVSPIRKKIPGVTRPFGRRIEKRKP